jgi:hypothetical protein
MKQRSGFVFLTLEKEKMFFATEHKTKPPKLSYIHNKNFLYGNGIRRKKIDFSQSRTISHSADTYCRRFFVLFTTICLGDLFDSSPLDLIVSCKPTLNTLGSIFHNGWAKEKTLTNMNSVSEPKLQGAASHR